MLMPKRVKRRKQFRGSMAGKALRGNTISNGEYGLVALEPCWIKSNQIEAARVAMTRYIKRGGKVWIKIFPDKPVTAKPAETRLMAKLAGLYPAAALIEIINEDGTMARLPQLVEVAPSASGSSPASLLSGDQRLVNDSS